MQTGSLNRILYVEDDLDIQKIVNMSLEDIGGYKLKICSSGKEALDSAKSFKPDLFLLDVMMPKMDGPTLLKEFRKIKEFEKTPAIFISAITHGEELIGFRQLGVLGIIRKPFDVIAISETINVLFQSNQVMQEDIKSIQDIESSSFIML